MPENGNFPRGLMRWGYKATYSVCFPSEQGLQRRKGCGNAQGAVPLYGLRARGHMLALLGYGIFLSPQRGVNIYPQV